MKVITRYLHLYLRFWQLAFSLGTVYRADTFFLFLSVILYLLQSFTFFGFTFRQLPDIGGWTFPQYSILLATYSLNWGLFKLLYGRVMEDVIDRIFTGQYDYYLLRPINARFLSYFCPPLIKSFPSVATNAIFLLWLLHYFNFSPPILNITIFIIYLILGQIIVFSFSQIAVVTSFFTNNAADIYAIFENAWDQSSYPGEAFTKSVHFTLTFIIPIILFASFPAKVLLGKVDNQLEYFFSPLVAVISLTVSNYFYQLGVKNYTSAGG
jgi:ABC-2 type transport system permease protein